MRDDLPVRTTLDLDDDLIQVAKELAAARRTTAGKVVSSLMRKALAAPQPVQSRNGVPVFPQRVAEAPRPTMKLVNELRDTP
jgi:hypothetical protein